MNRLACISTVIILGFVTTASAQAPASADLLRLVPDDMGVCLVVHDLRGYADAFEKSPWYKVVKKSPFGAALAETPEVRKLTKFADDLGKRLKLTWPQVRDEIFGNAVVLAHRAGAKPKDEQGLFLLKAGNAKLLAEFVARINHEQMQSKELKEVVELKHKGQSYFRRVDKNSTHYYFVQDAFLVLTGQEELLQRVLDTYANAKKSGPLPQHLQRAGADQALVSLWINPRSLDAELKDKANTAQGPEAYGLMKFLSIWQALDAVVLSFTPGRELEVSLSLQADNQKLPKVARRLFNETSKPSELWRRFPKDAVVTIAGRFDSGSMLEVLAEFTPPAIRNDMSLGLSKSVAGEVLKLQSVDLLKDVAPNIGPDWGICVAAAPSAKHYPHVIAALAVRPGEKAVDQSLVKALDFFANFLDLKLKIAEQDKIRVHYWSKPEVFPTGLQPSYALKDGFLVLASCPEAVLRFEKSDAASSATKEAMFFRLSMVELAKLVAQHKNQIAAFVALKNQVPPQQAVSSLDEFLKFIAPFDHLTLSHRADAGQVAWILRLGPAKSAE